MHSCRMNCATKTQTAALAIRLESPDGEQWTAIAGGETFADAVEFAIASAPSGVRWRVVGCSDVYGD